MCATAASVQNMHLMAAGMGLGAFWSSHTWCRRARDSAEWREYMGLKDPEDRVLGAFVMGKVVQGKTFRSKRDDWREKTQWEE